MLPLTKGHYTARLAAKAQDIDRALTLRHLCFITNRGLVTSTPDPDSFDNLGQHLLIEDTHSKMLVCCFRLMHFVSGKTVANSYSAQFYDLVRLSAFPGAMAELGRFCIHPEHSNPDILRLAWGAITRIVDETGVQILFGCTSFDGANPAKHQDALAYLKTHHLAPSHLRPGLRSPHAYSLADAVITPKATLTSLPPLLRTYLSMGGWVSDHAVIDTALNTLHVFTGLQIAAIPPARARLLRAIAT